MSNETWKDIEGYEGIYQVSDMGRIKSMAREKRNKWGTFMVGEMIMKPIIDRNGYRTIRLAKEGKQKAAFIHRLVLSAFVRSPGVGDDCNHKDGDKGNNSLSNLEWVSRSQNVAHAERFGLAYHPTGEGSHNAKFTNEQVERIRGEYEFGVRGKGTCVLAKKYGVSTRTMRRILLGETYPV